MIWKHSSNLPFQRIIETHCTPELSIYPRLLSLDMFKYFWTVRGQGFAPEPYTTLAARLTITLMVLC